MWNIISHKTALYIETTIEPSFHVRSIFLHAIAMGNYLGLHTCTCYVFHGKFIFLKFINPSLLLLADTQTHVITERRWIWYSHHLIFGDAGGAGHVRKSLLPGAKYHLLQIMGAQSYMCIMNTCMHNMTSYSTVYAIYFTSLIFLQIGTLRHFREWLNSRSRESNVLRTQVAFNVSESEVNIFACW